MDPVPSPFLPDSTENHLSSSDQSLLDSIRIRQQSQKLRRAFPNRSEFAVLDLDCCLLLALQSLESELRGFDVTVLLFLLAHFNHRSPTVKINMTELSRQMKRKASQVRRSIRNLEQLGWARFDRRGSIELSPVLIRSANPKYRAIHFRHAASSSCGDR